MNRRAIVAAPPPTEEQLHLGKSAPEPRDEITTVRKSARWKGGDNHDFRAELCHQLEQFGSERFITRDLHFPPLRIKRQCKQLRRDLFSLVARRAQENPNPLIGVVG